MQGLHFRFQQAEQIWSWRTLGPGGVELEGGAAASRAEAAAMVIRSIVRAESADRHTGPKPTMARAA